MHFSLHRRWSPWKIGFWAVLLVSGLAYARSLDGVFIWDDHQIMSGSAIGGGKRFADCFTRPFLNNYYRPLVSASFYLERPLFGQTPLLYHQTNVLLHVLTTAVLIGLLFSAFRRRSVALLGGLLFALQPVQVSAVAWIGGRTDSLCALWMALFAWSLVCGVQSEGRRRTALIGASLLAFTAAVFTKEQMLPAILLVPLAFWCWGRQEHGWRSTAVIHTLPFALPAFLFLVLWLLIVPSPPSEVEDSLIYVLTQSLRTITYYALLLFAPTPQWMHTMSLGGFVRAGLLPVAAGAVIALFTVWMLIRWLRHEPAAAWFLAFIPLTLLLVSNLYPVPSMLVTPYRAGVAGIGAAALMAWAIVRLGDRLLQRSALAERRETVTPASAQLLRAYALPGIAAAALALWWGGLTLWGAGLWKNEEMAARVFVRYDPDSIWARYNLTSALLNSRKHHEAIHHMETMLSRLFGSEAWRDSRNVVRMIQTDHRLRARVHEMQGTRIDTGQWFSDLYARLGYACLETGNIARARTAFEVGSRLSERAAENHAGLGECAFKEGKFEEAARWLRLTVAEDATYDRARSMLGKTYAELGRWKEARDQFYILTRRIPWSNNAYIEMAKAQLQLGDRQGAIATLEAASRNAPAHQTVKEMLTALRADSASL
jgi:tetratricopeptide (TPR) repeat protein